MEMTIQLNGLPYEIPAVMTVSGLLESLGFGGEPCVVELDGEAIFPRDHAVVMVVDGARVEVVTLAAGG